MGTSVGTTVCIGYNIGQSDSTPDHGFLESEFKLSLIVGRVIGLLVYMESIGFFGMLFPGSLVQPTGSLVQTVEVRFWSFGFRSKLSDPKFVKKSISEIDLSSNSDAIDATAI